MGNQVGSSAPPSPPQVDPPTPPKVLLFFLCLVLFGYGVNGQSIAPPEEAPLTTQSELGEEFCEYFADFSQNNLIVAASVKGLYYNADFSPADSYSFVQNNWVVEFRWYDEQDNKYKWVRTDTEGTMKSQGYETDFDKSNPVETDCSKSQSLCYSLSNFNSRCVPTGAPRVCGIEKIAGWPSCSSGKGAHYLRHEIYECWKCSEGGDLFLKSVTDAYSCLGDDNQTPDSDTCRRAINDIHHWEDHAPTECFDCACSILAQMTMCGFDIQDFQSLLTGPDASPPTACSPETLEAAQMWENLGEETLEKAQMWEDLGESLSASLGGRRSLKTVNDVFEVLLDAMHSGELLNVKH